MLLVPGAVESGAGAGVTVPVSAAGGVWLVSAGAVVVSGAGGTTDVERSPLTKYPTTSRTAMAAAISHMACGRSETALDLGPDGGGLGSKLVIMISFRDSLHRHNPKTGGVVPQEVARWRNVAQAGLRCQRGIANGSATFILLWSIGEQICGSVR